MELRKFIATTIREYLNENKNISNEYIAYHSSNSNITNFNFDDIELKPNSSTRIDGIFFSNKPQQLLITEAIIIVKFLSIIKKLYFLIVSASAERLIAAIIALVYTCEPSTHFLSTFCYLYL